MIPWAKNEVFGHFLELGASDRREIREICELDNSGTFVATSVLLWGPGSSCGNLRQGIWIKGW